MKHPEQIKTAPLNRASDLMTAREINAAFVPEIHFIQDGPDAISERFRACGWLVLYHPRKDKFYGKHHSKVVKGSKRRLQPRAVCKPKGHRRRSKV